MATKKLFITWEDITKLETVSDKTAKKRLSEYLDQVDKKEGQSLTLCEYAAIKDIDIKELCQFLHVDTSNYNWTLSNEAIENIKKRMKSTQS
jgi:hypothetical protein